MSKNISEEQVDHALSTIDSDGWAILREVSEIETWAMMTELRGSLDPRLAGKIGGIEWVFDTLVQRMKELKKEFGKERSE